MIALSLQIEILAELLCDTYWGDGTWSNPGTLPDELDRDKWRRLARVAISFLVPESLPADSSLLSGAGKE